MREEGGWKEGERREEGEEVGNEEGEEVGNEGAGRKAMQEVGKREG